MPYRLLVIASLLVATRAEAQPDTECACNVTSAACDVGCACDEECAVDWSQDECAQPGADCLPEAPDVDDATLATSEDAAATPDPVAWDVTAAVACPGGSHLDGDHCVLDEITGGCATSTPGAFGALFAVGLVAARRRRWLLAVAIASCSANVAGWDDLVDTGDPSAIDVYAADLGDGDGAQFLLAHQPLEAGALQPTAQFSLAPSGDTPIFRVSAATGDRLVTTDEPGAELLGWATPDGADLVELQRDGGYIYETDPDAIAARVADGYRITSTVARVSPPGLADPEPPQVSAAIIEPCHVTNRSAFELLYASPGADESERFLLGCPGEVAIGEKGETGPHSRMANAADQAAGGRTAFVLDRNGDKLRQLLLRANGLERTIAYLKHKLAIGYDYIAIDEITSAADWADGTTLNRRLRQLVLRMPIHTIVPYLSIDLMQYPPGASELRARRLLLRAFKLRARALALEIYMHTGQVEDREAPAVFRAAADRLALAVSGLAHAGGINLHAISVIGTSMHSTYPQYRYLDEPAHDLDAITREVNAIRHGSARLRQQHGLGYYFVGKSDMAPPGAYSYDALIQRMRLEALRFR